MMTQAAKTGVTVNFVYDPFHRNIRKDDGTNKTRYIYAGNQILAEYNDTSGALLNRYVYGFEADDPIIQVTSGGTVTYNTQDHVGSIIARTDSSGNILSKYKYAPFGESPSLSGTIFGFTGQRFDAETGLYHFKARYYDPVTGRFLQPDPISYGAGLNVYRYVKNSPLIHRDPAGNEELKVGGSAFLDELKLIAQYESNKAKNNGKENLTINVKTPGSPMKYKNYNEAVIAALKDATVISKITGNESGGIIYRNKDGTFNYNLRSGGEAGVTIEYNHPAGSRIWADFHSHGIANPKYRLGDETFSTADLRDNDKRRLGGWLVTPSKQVYFYDPTHKKGTGISTFGHLRNMR